MGQTLENTQYFFNGQLFLDYIDYDEFKRSVKEETGIAHISGEEFSSFYKRSIIECGDKNKIDKLFFENILYGRLTNVFIHKINNGPISQEIFKIKVNELITNWNEGSHLPEDLKELMNPEPGGYYLMDQLYYTRPNTKFIAGTDFIENDGMVEKARFLVVKVVPTGTIDEVQMKYHITGVEIDFINQTYCIYVKNLQKILPIENLQEHEDEEEEEKDKTKTVLRTHKYYYDVFKNSFGINRKIDAEQDRKGMFILCKELTDRMLEEIKRMVIERVEDVNKAFVDKLVESLFTSPIQSLVDKSDINNRFLSVLIAVYIQVLLEDDEIINIAKDRKLIGYPTKVSFRKENASQGSTGSSGAKSPIASQIMFHSLHADFEEALQLPNWAISWFRDILHTTGSCEVAQTSITCKQENFHVVFKNNKYIGKELLLHVIRELNKHRNY